MRKLIVVLTVLWGGSLAVADTIEFAPGSSFDCTVLQENDQYVAVLRNVSILRFPRSAVSRISKDSASGRTTERSSESASRLPNYATVVVQLARNDWATDLRQIPATVIDTGVLRNVPYKSQRAGGDYEINIYGDPGNPAGFEIGVRGKLLDDEQARKNCVAFTASLLSDSEDKATVARLKMDKDLVVRNELTFEVTPSTADDAYGGWWVSVYGEAILDKVRATEKELKSITVSKQSLKDTKTPAPKLAGTVNNDEQLAQWNADDLNYARPSRNKSSGGGPVYVRDYYRKDGTYVHSHTRSR
jgi:hypothetical protein